MTNTNVLANVAEAFTLVIAVAFLGVSILGVSTVGGVTPAMARTVTSTAR